MPLGMEVGLGPGHIVIDGYTAPLPHKRGHSPPIFDPYLLWQNGWMDQDATWYGGRPRPKPHCARWGPSFPLLQKRGPQFSTNVCCGQMDGWIKMPFGTKVGLGPGHIVLHGYPAPPPHKKGIATPPIFRPCLLWPNGRPSQLLLSTC